MQIVVEVHPKDRFDRDCFENCRTAREVWNRRPAHCHGSAPGRALCRPSLSNTKLTPSSVLRQSWTNHPNTRIDFWEPNGPNAGTPCADLHQRRTLSPQPWSPSLMPTGEIQNVDLFQSPIQSTISGLKSNGNPANNSRTNIYFFHLRVFLFPMVYQQKFNFSPCTYISPYTYKKNQR